MNKAFTLLELLIVVVVLGILALIAVPTLLNTVDKAKDSSIAGNVNAASSSISGQFALDNSQSYSTMISNVVNDLNDGNNVNPADPDDTAPFVDGAATCSQSTIGKVYIQAASTSGNESITITGCKVDGSSTITKVIKGTSESSGGNN